MSTLDQAKEVRQGESLDTGTIGAYLKENIPGLDGRVTIRQFHSGFSNLTYLVGVGDKDLVLRRPPFGKKAKSAHDMSREFRILSAIREVFPYAPSPLIYCDDLSVMDAPFYVMERLQGIILRKNLPDGFALDKQGIRRLCERLVEVHVALHQLDYAACGLGDFGNPEGYVARQIHGWSGRYRDARTPDVPDFEEVMEWLADNMPADHARPALIHNDYKFDNVILHPADPTHIIGVLDWEMATIGDPLMDLGASMAYWVQKDDPDEVQLVRMLATTADGMMSRRQIVDLYAELTGTSIDNFAWYYCYGLFRLAVIAQQIYYRFYHGQTKDKRFQMLGFAVGILENAARGVIAKGTF